MAREHGHEHESEHGRGREDEHGRATGTGLRDAAGVPVRGGAQVVGEEAVTPQSGRARASRARVRDAGGHGGDVLQELPDGVLVRLDDGRQVLLPPEALRLERDGSYSIGFDLAPAAGDPQAPERLRDAVPLDDEDDRWLARSGSRPAGPVSGTGAAERSTPRESGTVPVLSEDLVVERRSRVTGGVRLHKHVSERTAEVDEPVVRERVVVERVPVNEPIRDGRIPQVHERDDGVLVVPVLEEVLVVQKRLVLKEELHVRRVREETRERQSVSLKREHVEVERFDASGRPLDRPGDRATDH